jgi:hypothetical protein
MSLQIWLPFNGKVENQGFLSGAITRVGVTTNSHDASFNGSSDYIKFSPGIPSTSTSFTFSAFVYHNTSSNWNTLYSQRTSVGHGLTVFISSSNVFRFDGGSNQWYPSYTLPLQTWTHICFTFDGNTNTKSFYVNGVLHSTYTASSGIISLGTTGFIGGASSSAGTTPNNYYFNGKMRDLRIYDNAISAKEVKELSKGLFIHYKMDNTSYYDCSGFEYNGINNGNLTLSTDTAKYSNSTLYSGTDQYVLIPNISPETFSVAFWFKRTADTGTRQFLYTGWYGVSCELTTDGRPFFRVYDGSKTYDATSSGAILKANGWTHYVGIFEKGVGSKIYINGELKASTAITNPITWNLTYGNRIGRYGGNATYLSAQMSDFRIYSTALSESDIKELYNTSAAIDNIGNLYTREDVEVDTTTIKINKTGVINNIYIKENDTDKKTSFFKDGTIICNNFIEF